jgi:phospholipid transport system substrate-binding protein
MSHGWKSPGSASPWYALMVAVLIYFTFPPSALAAGPQNRIRETLDAISAVLDDPQLQGPDKEMERTQRVRRIIHDTFAFEEMAREALGAHWAKLTPQQREEFIPLFGDLFEQSYNRLVLKFLPGRQTSYGKESIEQDRATVQTTLVVPKTKEQLAVDYRLIEKAQRWAAFDVVVDGVSIAGNYRAQFDKILRTSSYDMLVQQIKRKLEQASF